MSENKEYTHFFMTGWNRLYRSVTRRKDRTKKRSEWVKGRRDFSRCAYLTSPLFAKHAYKDLERLTNRIADTLNIPSPWVTVSKKSPWVDLVIEK